MRHSNLNTTSKRDIFLKELSRVGPDSQEASWSLSQSQAYCRNWARSQYENFTVVSLLLPRNLRQDFANIYCYCRWADDLADETGDPDRALQLLDWWESELRSCTSGHPRHPVLIALQKTIHENVLPEQHFLDLLTAFRQDQSRNRYEDEAELLQYCQYSANPVGRILLALAKSSSPESIRLSDEVCTGLQLANFCQDMGRDAADNRIYAPKTLWIQHGIVEADLLSLTATPHKRELLADWVATSRGHFERGWQLVSLVPRWLATDVDLFVRGGLAILNQIERADFDVWTQRPTVSKTRKFGLLCQSLWAGWVGRRRVGSHPTLQPAESSDG